MSDLLTLSEMESEDSELIPEIVAIDTRLSISASVEKLIPLFAAVVAIAPTKEIIPGTSYVMLEAVDATATSLSYVRASATDGDRSVAVIEDAVTVHLAGGVLMPGKKILDILKLVSTEKVRIDVLGSAVMIRAGRAQWSVQTPKITSLPPFADVQGVELHTVDRKEFLSALETVQKSAAKSSARMALMQAELKQSKLTTCDGARVHRVLLEDVPKSINTTLPMNLIEAAIRELNNIEDEKFLFGANKSTVVFHLGRKVLMGQKLTLAYPDVDHLSLEPALMNTEELTVDPKELAATIKRVRINADPEFMAVILNLRQIKGAWNLVISARDKNNNASQEVMPVKYVGPATEKEIVVNHKFLTEFLECIHENEITLKLGQSTKTKQAPVLAQSGNFTGVLNPMAPNLVKV